MLIVALPSMATDRFLPAEEAFRMSAVRTAQDRVALRFDIAPGYYLYRAALAVQADGATVGPLELPAGMVKFDENFGKDVETYHGTLAVGVVLAGAGDAPLTLTVQSQGCAEAGLCYPIATTRVRLVAIGVAATPADPGAVASAGSMLASASSSALPVGAAGADSADRSRVPVIAGLVAAMALVVGVAVWWVRRR